MSPVQGFEVKFLDDAYTAMHAAYPGKYFKIVDQVTLPLIHYGNPITTVTLFENKSAVLLRQ